MCAHTISFTPYGGKKVFLGLANSILSCYIYLYLKHWSFFMDIVIGLTLGGLLFIFFDFIDYYWFSSFLRKRVFPNSLTIIVLDDEESWTNEAYVIQLSDAELARISNGEKVYNVITEDYRWKRI